MSSPTIEFAAPHLFGNEAAEDEDEDIFATYAIDRDEVQAFADPQRRLCFVRAYKGEGKSALLRLVARRLQRSTASPLVIRGPVNSFAPTATAQSFDDWLKNWKASLLERVAREVGTTINFAWTDDAMSLVEQAEKTGYRSRGLVASILDRIKPKIKLGLSEANVEVSSEKLGTTDPERTLQRWVTGQEPIWLIVDDVDQNFENTESSRARAAAFFVACRQITNVIPELRIRAAVRPNVWTTLKLHFEPLSHVEQYMTDLAWDEQSIRRMLSKRVEGYLVRTAQWESLVDTLPTDSMKRDRALIALVFEDPMPWGKKERPPHVVLRTLSKHRPRWLVELSAIAGRDAKNQRRIMLENILSRLDEFGRRRIQDTVAEFRSQCPQVDEVISALHGGREEFSTDELIDLMRNKVTNHLTPKISGVLGEPSPTDIAAFLFEIGVIFARRDDPDGEYHHFGYSERPTLLKSRSNLDEGLRWEVHPVFRQALEIRDQSGQELNRQPRRRIVAPKGTS